MQIECHQGYDYAQYKYNDNNIIQTHKSSASQYLFNRVFSNPGFIGTAEGGYEDSGNESR